MLASIIANLQNVPAAAAKPLPTVKIDRGGGGPLWGPRYDIVDITMAIRLFQEIPGEDSVARAARRMRWIGEALPGIREAREKREGAAFLAGATIANVAAEDRYKLAAAEVELRHKQANEEAEERRRLIDQLKIEQLIEIIDEVRGSTVPAAEPKTLLRGQYSSRTSGAAIAVALGIGVAIGVVLTRVSSGRARPAHA
jgi:hypothetical protein